MSPIPDHKREPSPIDDFIVPGIKPPAYSDGRAFLGDFIETPARKYIHAAADRFDNEYDTIRAVRDSRYKYLRNYNLDKAYYLPLPYREQMPIMRELLQLNEQGKLNRFQAQWFREQKPLEELFDTDIDPYELQNLAQDPAYSNKLKELSDELDSWLLEVDDLGFTPENELIEHFWPGGVHKLNAHVGNRGGNVARVSFFIFPQLGFALRGPYFFLQKDQ